MRLSTKGRYGLIAMVDLAVHASEGCVSLSSIAERQHISEHYLEQLFSLLRKAGLVKSTRGVNGGYLLAYEPNQITAGDILRALEGSLAPVDCIHENTHERCEMNEACVTRTVWKQVYDCINEVIESVTLKDLADDYVNMKNNDFLMYYI